MRFRLRTLLIAMAVGPPLIATLALSFLMDDFPGIPLTLAILTVMVILRARQARRSLIGWSILLWVCGEAAAFAVGFPIMNYFAFNRSEALADGGYGWDVIKAAVLATAIAVGSLIVFASGRPIPASSISS
jgi:hypothetical protein